MTSRFLPWAIDWNGGSIYLGWDAFKEVGVSEEVGGSVGFRGEKSRFPIRTC